MAEQTLVVVAVVALLVLVAVFFLLFGGARTSTGTVETQEEQQVQTGVGEQQEQQENVYDVGESITPMGYAAKWDEKIRPALEKVFGDVALKDFQQGEFQGLESVSLLYMISRDLKEGDADKIAQAIQEDLGWTPTLVATDSPGAVSVHYIVPVDGAQYQVIIHYGVGGNGVYVDVQQLPQS